MMSVLSHHHHHHHHHVKVVNIVNVVNVTGTGALSVNSVEVTSNTFTVNGNSLNTVAFTGNYADLTGTPTIFNGNYDMDTNRSCSCNF